MPLKISINSTFLDWTPFKQYADIAIGGVKNEVFEDYHGIITPSSSGVADKGLKSTGSADFQKIWTYLGLPTISLPLLTGENDLPLGVQLVGDKLDDLRFLGTANWLEINCKDEQKICYYYRMCFMYCFSSWISNYLNKIYDDWFHRRFASLYSDGNSNCHDAL